MNGDLEPISAKDQSRLYQFGKTVSLGIFLEYALHAGRILERRYLDAGEIHARRPKCKRNHHADGTTLHVPEGKLDGSQPKDTITNDSARKDVWSIEGNYICRYQVEQRAKLHVAREESFPMPLRHIDVIRRTHATLDVEQESRTDDHWNVDGDRNLSESWTGFTQFTMMSETPPNGYMWSRGRLTKNTSDNKA